MTIKMMMMMMMMTMMTKMRLMDRIGIGVDVQCTMVSIDDRLVLGWRL